MLLSRNSKACTLEYFQILARAGWQAIDINETEDFSLFCQPADVQLDFLKREIDNIHSAGLIANQCHAPMVGSYAGINDEELDAGELVILDNDYIYSEDEFNKLPFETRQSYLENVEKYENKYMNEKRR